MNKSIRLYVIMEFEERLGAKLEYGISGFAKIRKVEDKKANKET